MIHGFGRQINGSENYYIGECFNDEWHGIGEYKNGPMKIHQIGQFKNGRFIVKSKVREIPEAFDFDKIRERIADLSKKGEELEVEKKKRSSAADWVIASLITVFVGAVWSLLLFSS